MTQAMEVEPLKDIGSDYDCFFAAIGFEQRARYLAEHQNIKAKCSLACGFEDRHVLAYEANRAWFAENGFECEEVGDTEFMAWTTKRVSEIAKSVSGNLRLCVDVSSFSRVRIAALLRSIRSITNGRLIEIDIVYCGATYSPPSEESVPNLSIGPILPEFAGWSVEPDRPPVLVLGLGYENDKAIGAVEYIEPAAIWAFEPTGHDERYSAAIRQANRTLWDVLPQEKRLPYSVYHPYDCFVNLESLTFGLVRESRPVLVPFGPKLFAVCCLLVSFAHPMVSVWRVSSGHLEPASDRISNGRIAGLRVKFAPNSTQNG